MSDDQSRMTPGWVVATGAIACGLVLAMIWAVLPWEGALMATGGMMLAAEFGMSGARWHDDRQA